MQTVILAGGVGSRLSEETGVTPKPMVEIGGQPMIRHIMAIYADQGHEDFVVALGHLGHVIQRYFAEQGRVPWRVRPVETGDRTETGGRLKRLRPHLDGPFMLTYGDGVADIDLASLVAFHRRHGGTATITIVHPPARFGAVDVDEGRVTRFSEKAQASEGWINGGFMVFEPRVLDLIDGDDTVLERDVLPRLAERGELYAYRHTGFWHCMDTLRDVRALDALARGATVPWRR